MRSNEATQYEFFDLPITIGMGNVLTTVTDKKIPVDVGNNGTIDWYVADITSATDSAKCYFETYTYKVQNLHWLMPISKSLKFDKSELLRIHNRYYYPFGSPMDGRTFSSDKYRFGFNGKELDNEIQGDGNAYDFGARIYDSRLGRWLSLDPLMAKYPGMSPYNFCANSPVLFVDFDGKDFGVLINHEKHTITIIMNVYVVNEEIESANTAKAFWEGQNDKFAYKFGEGADDQYDIKFEVNVIPVASDDIAENMAKNDEKGNSLIVRPDKDPSFLEIDNNGKVALKPDGTPKYHLGHVSKGQLCAINVSNKKKSTVSHEFGHFLDICHWVSGIMFKDVTRVDEVTPGMINKILDKVGIDCGNYSDGDTPTSQGRADEAEQEKRAKEDINGNERVASGVKLDDIGSNSKYSDKGVIVNKTK